MYLTCSRSSFSEEMTTMIMSLCDTSSLVDTKLCDTPDHLNLFDGMFTLFVCRCKEIQVVFRRSLVRKLTIDGNEFRRLTLR